MKRMLYSFLSLGVCLGLLAGCGTFGQSAAGGSGEASPGGFSSSAPASGALPEGDTTQPVQAEMDCRVVKRDGDQLLLARLDGTAGEVYRLTLTEEMNGGGEEIAAGSRVQILYSGSILEIFPAQFGQVAMVSPARGDFDDLCRLYLEVLEDLWAVDPGLNEGITELGVDLSGTRLSAAEQSAVAWAFGEAHGITPVQGTLEQLAEQGYLAADDSEAGKTSYHWENGCLFRITEQESPAGTYSLNTIRFDAEKWRSGTGAYFFTECSAVQSALGAWSEYTIGAEAIS